MGEVSDEELDRLRKAAHEAPLNKVGMDHKGRRFLATHSMAWASASRAYLAALDARRQSSEAGR